MTPGGGHPLAGATGLELVKWGSSLAGKKNYGSFLFENTVVFFLFESTVFFFLKIR